MSASEHGVKPLRLRMHGLIVRVFGDAEQRKDVGENLDGNTRVKDQQGLTWNPQRQFHAGEDDDTLVRGYRSAAFIDLGSRRGLNEGEKTQVVVVGNCDRVEPFQATGRDERAGELFPISFRNWACAVPLIVPWAVYLKVAAIISRALVHGSSLRVEMGSNHWAGGGTASGRVSQITFDGGPLRHRSRLLN